MNKKLIFCFLLMVTFGTTATACDICGCGAGSNYIGILPDFSKKIVGMRYRYGQLYSHLGVNGSTTYLTTKETYQTVELWGAWNLGKKARIMTAIPQNFNSKSNQGKSYKKSGLGDISLIGFYQLLNKRKVVNHSNLLVQGLWIGSGVKLPTGKYKPEDKSNTASDANLFQLGTGSVDVTFNLMYDIRLQDAGVNINSSYKINSSNKYQYDYGNKMSVSAQGYYKWRLAKQFSIAPNAGILCESAKKDWDKSFSVNASGGKIILGTVGVESIYQSIGFGMGFQSPLSQHLAEGMVKGENRFFVHLSWLF